MRTRMARFAVCSLLAVSLVLLGIAGCSPSDAEDNGTETSDQAVETTASAGGQAGEQPAADSDMVDWFVGRWSVDFELTSVSPDADWSRKAAGQSLAEWESMVEGSQMLIDTGQHLYSGTFVANGDDWSYDGVAVYLDDVGVEWTSHIVVDGTRQDGDSFIAGQWGEIASDIEGTLYVATWDAIGIRVPE